MTGRAKIDGTEGGRASTIVCGGPQPPNFKDAQLRNRFDLDRCTVPQILQVSPSALLTTEDNLTPTHHKASSDSRRRHLHPADRVALPFPARGIIGAHLEDLQFFREALEPALAQQREPDARQPTKFTVSGRGDEDLVRLGLRRNTRCDVQAASDVATLLIDSVTPVHCAPQRRELRFRRRTTLDLQSAHECCAWFGENQQEGVADPIDNSAVEPYGRFAYELG